jgi:hypothetical protein
MRFFAQKLANADLQDAMKVRDPPLLALDQGLIVQVGIADERIFFESHEIPSERGQTRAALSEFYYKFGKFGGNGFEMV